MKIVPFRIPKQIVLPGLVVHVVLAPRDSPELEGDKGAWQYETEAGRGMIYLAQELPVEEQRYVLLHELQHAMVDYLGEAIYPGRPHAKYFRVC